MHTFPSVFVIGQFNTSICKQKSHTYTQPAIHTLKVMWSEYEASCSADICLGRHGVHIDRHNVDIAYIVECAESASHVSPLRLSLTLSNERQSPVAPPQHTLHVFVHFTQRSHFPIENGKFAMSWRARHYRYTAPLAIIPSRCAVGKDDTLAGSGVLV